MENEITNEGMHLSTYSHVQSLSWTFDKIKQTVQYYLSQHCAVMVKADQEHGSCQHYRLAGVIGERDDCCRDIAIMTR